MKKVLAIFLFALILHLHASDKPNDIGYAAINSRPYEFHLSSVYQLRHYPSWKDEINSPLNVHQFERSLYQRQSAVKSKLKYLIMDH